MNVIAPECYKVVRLMSCYWVVSLPAANHTRLSIVPSKHSGSTWPYYIYKSQKKVEAVVVRLIY